MSDAPGKFEAWAIVEVMGHGRFAGFVQEATLAGAPFLRIDVPAVSGQDGDAGQQAFTRYLGAGSIFAITPCTEDLARKMAAAFRSRPAWVYEMPRLPAPAGAAMDDRDDGIEDLDDFDDGT